VIVSLLLQLAKEEKEKKEKERRRKKKKKKKEGAWQFKLVLQHIVIAPLSRV
jgi:hypothetical protein